MEKFFFCLLLYFNALFIKKLTPYNILVNLLKEVLEINIIILNSNEYANEFYNYPLLYDYDKDINTVILLYENNIHFKLIGHFKDNNMTYFFNNKNIPEEILKLNNFVR